VHRLLRNRDALLVTRAEEVLEAVAPIGTHLLVEERAPSSARDLLPPEARLVLEAVPMSRPAALGSIAYVAGMHELVVATALDQLVAADFVTRHADGWQLARP
jgi:DNA processing protein